MRTRTVVIAGVAGAVGFALGVVSTAWFMSRFLRSAQATSAVATVAVDGLALQDILKDDATSATGLLQSRLDGSLMTISWEVEDGYTLTPDAKKAISRVKRLRESSGYEPADPDVRRDVRHALSLADPNE